MQFAPLAAALALAWKIVDFAKQLRVRDWDAVVTQLAVWGAGVLVIFLLAWTDFAAGVAVGGHKLSALNAGSKLLIGLTVGSSASVGYDLKRAIDRNDSAAMPSLVSGRVPIVPPPTVDADKPHRRRRAQHDEAGEIGAVLVVILLLALVLGGLGFAVHVLWWIALIVLAIFLVGLLLGRRP